MNLRKSLYAVFSLAIFLAAASIAGAAPCGDTAGPAGEDVPCSCGDTVVTDTKLTAADPVVSIDEADLCPPGDGLIFLPPSTTKITLNLNNLQLRGTFGGVGIRIVGTDVKTFVINGRIKGFDTAIATDAGSTTEGAVIQGIVALNNINGIELEGHSGLIKSNQVTFNTGTGIQLRGDEHDLEFTTISHNNGDGVVVNGNGNLLRQLDLNKNDGTAISVTGNNNAFDHIEAENNGGDGLVVVGDGDGNPNTVEFLKIKIDKNKGDGVSVTGNNHNIELTQAASNGGSGITVSGTGNSLKSSKGTSNKEDGLLATGGGNFNQGGNSGKKNGGVQCAIDGIACN